MKSNMPKWLRYDAGITFYQLLNAIELWYMQLMEASPPGTYRDQQLDNIIGSINSQLDCPGVHEFWDKVKHLYVPGE